MKTGYFASEKRPYTRSKVHVVFRDNKPICGSKLGKDSKFQWCAMTVQRRYVECQKCVDRLNEMGL